MEEENLFKLKNLFFNKNNVYLILFYFSLFLFYLNIPFIQFILFIPLFFYLKEIKEINLIKHILGISVISIINFIYFIEYGIKFIIVAIFANILFFIPFIYFSFKLIKKEYYYLSIPSLFFIEYYIFGIITFNNFWLNFNATLISYPLIIQYIGSPILNSIIILLNCLIFKIIITYLSINKNKNRNIDKNTSKNTNKSKNLNINKNMNSKNIQNINQKTKRDLIINIIILISITSIFFIPIKEIQTEKTLKIAAIQGNIKEDWFERMDNFEKNFQEYLELSNKALKNNPDIIIWPEYSITHPLELDYNTQKKLLSYSHKNNITLIIGSTLMENKSSSNSKRYNSLFIFENNTLRHYNAYEPVTIFDPMAAKAESNSPIIIKNTSLGFALCYEENYQYIFSKQIQENLAELFLVIGNQYQLNSYHGLYLSSLSSHLRAIENNRYVLRLETSGISKVIKNNGKIALELKINTKDILFYDIPLNNKKTFYSKNKNQIETFFLILSIIILISISINFKKIIYNKTGK